MNEWSTSWTGTGLKNFTHRGPSIPRREGKGGSGTGLHAGPGSTCSDWDYIGYIRFHDFLKLSSQINAAIGPTESVSKTSQKQLSAAKTNKNGTSTTSWTGRRLSFPSTAPPQLAVRIQAPSEVRAPDMVSIGTRRFIVSASGSCR